MNNIIAKRNLLFLFLSLFTFSINAQKLERVAVITPEHKEGEMYTKFVEYDGNLFFVSPSIYGLEIWMTDGTENGTKLLKDINEGNAGSNPSDLVVFNEKLFFTADDGIHGLALWSSDGTPEGTKVFLDVNPSLTDFSLKNLTVLNEKLLFAADDGIKGLEVWATDGTVKGTAILKDINTGGSSTPSQFKLFGDHIYFMATDVSRVNLLWKTDGTPAGTASVTDLPTEGVAATFLDAIKDSLYFTLQTGIYNQELWKTDGTAKGTKAVKKFDVFNTVGSFCFHKDKIFFGLNSELWSTNGTTSGTIRIKTINETSAPVTDLTSFNGKVYFSGRDSLGYELWSTDGTAKGTVIFKDIAPKAADANPGLLTIFNKKLFFRASEGKNSNELWFTSGSADNTKVIYPADRPAPAGEGPLSQTYNMAVFNGALYFLAKYDTKAIELWKVKDVLAATEDEVEVNALFLSPNPATDIVSLLTDKVMEISISGIDGVLINNFKNGSPLKNFDVSHLPAGLYIVALHLENNKKVNVKLAKK